MAKVETSLKAAKKVAEKAEISPNREHMFAELSNKKLKSSQKEKFS